MIATNAPVTCLVRPATFARTTTEVDWFILLVCIFTVKHHWHCAAGVRLFGPVGGYRVQASHLEADATSPGNHVVLAVYLPHLACEFLIVLLRT